jgi:hypothetical protein
MNPGIIDWVKKNLTTLPAPEVSSGEVTVSAMAHQHA